MAGRYLSPLLSAVFPETGPLTDPGAYHLARLAASCRTFPSPPPEPWSYGCVGFSMGAGGLNCGPYACLVSTSATEPLKEKNMVT